ncbi:hypothetical protein ElyMa_000499200 [Elysia marginata]|uniref:Uncharacterized protein n=1 Tax=Elysia marginata TaxID=1093978 RepID=A0AAV4FUR2_9GAST|nr:hypothetical protein ElyMa_000499200 [Elysia marginata]
MSRNDSLCKAIMQGTVEGGRTRRQRKPKLDNVKEWAKLIMTNFQIQVVDRPARSIIIASSSDLRPIHPPDDDWRYHLPQ